jgi:hypothetical protein
VDTIFQEEDCLSKSRLDIKDFFCLPAHKSYTQASGVGAPDDQRERSMNSREGGSNLFKDIPTTAPPGNLVTPGEQVALGIDQGP